MKKVFFVLAMIGTLAGSRVFAMPLARTPCQSWVQAATGDDTAYKPLIQGYALGYADAIRGANKHAELDMNQMSSFIISMTSYCAGHPEQNISAAAGAVAALMP